ncbi:MAG: MFS transporter, partial [Solirubrobacteraceae bacterium]
MSAHADPHHERRWLILGVIGLAQLMVVLDITVVNVALPSAQRDLGFSTFDRQWSITAYALAFGSLLLLGGRIGDLFGRKWTFVYGLIGFAFASAVGGAATSFAMLVASRAAQGVFGSILAPSALGLLTTTFTDGAERGKAFGIFSAIAGSGGAIGLLLGGVLTQLISWRACMYVNAVIAVPAALGAVRLLVNEGRPDRPALDLPGAATASLGLFALVYGFSNAETHSWGNPLTIGMLVACVVLLGAFVALERRVAHPMLPLRVVLDRARGGSYLAVAITGIAIFGAFLFLTYYLQTTKHFTPIQTGLAFLPMSVAIIVAAVAANVKLLRRFGPRPLMASGMVLGAAGMAWLATLTATSGYVDHVLPALVIMGLGFGNTFAPAIFTATYGVQRQDAGVASAMVNTMQQVSGAIGASFLSTIFA